MDSSAERPAVVPETFRALYYFRLAFKIACWDCVSIRSASRDLKAGIYGAVLWAIMAILIMLFDIPHMLRTFRVSGPALILVVGVGVISGFIGIGLLTLIEVGGAHLIAKLFGAKGTLMSVMRPSLLGSIVGILNLIPVVGDWAFRIAWTAVLVLVFEEVDSINRIEALAICVVINIAAHQLLGRLGV